MLIEFSFLDFPILNVKAFVWKKKKKERQNQELGKLRKKLTLLPTINSSNIYLESVLVH